MNDMKSNSSYLQYGVPMQVWAKSIVPSRTLEIPRSPNTSLPLPNKKTFWVFKSLCKTLLLCMQCNPKANCTNQCKILLSENKLRRAAFICEARSPYPRNKICHIVKSREQLDTYPVAILHADTQAFIVFGQERIDVSYNIWVMKSLQKINFYFGSFSFLLGNIFNLDDFHAYKVSFHFVSHQIDLTQNQNKIYLCEDFQHKQRFITFPKLPSPRIRIGS